jgi:hypothetical protein
MAFNGLGRMSLKAGYQTWVWMVRDDVFLTDYGAQWIMPHAEMNTGYYPDFGTCILQVDHHQKEVRLQADTGGTYVTYHCLITNVGNKDAIFSIQGGGNV